MSKRARRAAWLTATLAVGAITIVVVHRSPPQAPTHAVVPLLSPYEAGTRDGDTLPATATPRTVIDNTPSAPSAAASERLPALPNSLRETEVDGGLLVDEHERLVISIEARRFFDYFLSASGEEDAADIRSRIVAEIRHRLPATAATQAIALLDLYLEYRARVRQLAESGNDLNPNDLAARLEQLRSLRRETLGEATAHAFFADEEGYDAVAAEQRRVALDPTIADSDRERQMHDLDEQLPPAVRAARDEALAPLRLAAQEDELRAVGGSPEEIRALREQYFGTDGADRLEELDREQAVWRSRYGKYKADRLAIEGDTTRSAEERAAAIEELLSRHFTPQEQIRARALATIDDEISAE